MYTYPYNSYISYSSHMTCFKMLFIGLLDGEAAAAGALALEPPRREALVAPVDAAAGSGAPAATAAAAAAAHAAGGELGEQRLGGAAVAAQEAEATAGQAPRRAVVVVSLLAYRLSGVVEDPAPQGAEPRDLAGALFQAGPACRSRFSWSLGVLHAGVVHAGVVDAGVLDANLLPRP